MFLNLVSTLLFGLRAKKKSKALRIEGLLEFWSCDAKRVDFITWNPCMGRSSILEGFQERSINYRELDRHIKLQLLAVQG